MVLSFALPFTVNVESQQLNNAEALFSFGDAGDFVQLGLSDLAVGDRGPEMIADFPDDVDGQEQLFAAVYVVDSRAAPSFQVCLFKYLEGVDQHFVIKQLARANRVARGANQFVFIRHGNSSNAARISAGFAPPRT